MVLISHCVDVVPREDCEFDEVEIVTCDSGDLCEVYLVVRPEEKWLVARALEGQVGAFHSSFCGLGRGLDGGLTYARAGRKPALRNLLGWPRNAQLATFLPKAVFYLVLPRELANQALEAARVALRTAGGPAECARGFGWIAPILCEVPVGAVGGASISSAEPVPSPRIPTMAEAVR